MAIRRYGTVKWWDEDRRFGWVAPDGDDENVFVGGGAFDHAGITPHVELRLAFKLDMDRLGRQRATDLAVNDAEAA